MICSPGTKSYFTYNFLPAMDVSPGFCGVGSFFLTGWFFPSILSRVPSMAWSIFLSARAVALLFILLFILFSQPSACACTITGHTAIRSINKCLFILICFSFAKIVMMEGEKKRCCYQTERMMHEASHPGGTAG